METFPVLIDLPDLLVKIDLNLDRTEYFTDDASWILSTVALTVFSSSELDQAAANSRASALRSEGATAPSEELSTALAAEQNTSSSPDSAADTLSAIDTLRSFLQLLVSGSIPLAGPATALGSRYAFIQPSFKVEAVVTTDTALILNITRLQMYVRRAGAFKLQVKATGMVSPIVGDIKVEKYNADTFTKVVIQKLFKFSIVAVITGMALGNSDWHDPRIGVPISLTIIGILMWANVDQFGDTFGSLQGVGWWYVFAYTTIAVFTLVGLVGWKERGRWPRVKPFADVRRERYFAYVRRLVNSPSFESGLLRREHECKLLRAQGLSLKPWQGLSKVEPFLLKDRLMLELRITQAVEQ